MRAALLALAVLVATADAKGAEPVAAKPVKKKHLAWTGPAAGPTMTGDPELIFTFDDGPNPKTTPAVLDTLKAHNIHAIFFLVGENAAKEHSAAVIDRIIREGHIVANHTMTHQDLCRVKEDERAAGEIDKGHDTIESRAHMTLVWFRTPYGARCERLDNLLAERGITHFHWDLDPQEWRNNNSKKAFEYVTKRLARMTGRNVLLMHDIKKATVDALPQILDWIDQENARRKEARIRRIRIIQSWELAEERLPVGLMDWLTEVTPSREGLAKSIASVLP